MQVIWYRRVNFVDIFWQAKYPREFSLLLSALQFIICQKPVKPICLPENVNKVYPSILIVDYTTVPLNYLCKNSPNYYFYCLILLLILPLLLLLYSHSRTSVCDDNSEHWSSDEVERFVGNLYVHCNLFKFIYFKMSKRVFHYKNFLVCGNNCNGFLQCF